MNDFDFTELRLDGFQLGCLGQYDFTNVRMIIIIIIKELPWL